MTLWAYFASSLWPIKLLQSQPFLTDDCGLLDAYRWLKFWTGIAQRERQIVRTAIGGTLVGLRVPAIIAQFDATCGHFGSCQSYFQDPELLGPQRVKTCRKLLGIGLLHAFATQVAFCACSWTSVRSDSEEIKLL